MQKKIARKDIKHFIFYNYGYLSPRIKKNIIIFP